MNMPDTGFYFSDGQGRNSARRRLQRTTPSAVSGEYTGGSASGVGGISCPSCHVVLVDNSALRAHVSEFHGQSMPYSCYQCGRGYFSPSGLSRHFQSHKGKTFVCPICDSRFTQKFTVKSHLRTVHGLDQCVHCSAVLKLGSEFSQHMDICGAGVG